MAFFNGAMAGDLLAASWDGGIRRIELNADGTSVTNITNIFNVSVKYHSIIVQTDKPF